MKRLTLFLIALLLAAGIGAQELKIGTLNGYKPYSPAIIKAFKEAGLSVSIAAFETQPELSKALATKKVDGAFFMAQPLVAQIKGAVLIPVRLNQTNFFAITLDPAIRIKSPADLRKYTVGIVGSNAAHKAITRGVTTVSAGNDRELFIRLKAGDFQVALTVDKLAPIMSKAAKLGKYYLSDRPLLSTPTFLALAASQAAHKKKIEIVLKKWLADGTWEAETKKAEKAGR